MERSLILTGRDHEERKTVREIEVGIGRVVGFDVRRRTSEI